MKSVISKCICVPRRFPSLTGVFPKSNGIFLSRLYSSNLTPGTKYNKLPKAAKKSSGIRRLPRPVTRAPPDSSINTTIDNENNLLQSSINPCTTVVTCEQYDLSLMSSIAKSKGFLQAHFLIPKQVFYISYPLKTTTTNVNGTIKNIDLFILNNGSVVSWGMTETQLIDLILPILKPAEINTYDNYESEEMDYIEKSLQKLTTKNSNENEIETISSLSEIDPEPEININPQLNTTAAEINEDEILMKGDIIFINSSSTNEQNLLDKLAFASGIARSTKLAILESILENYIQNTKSLTNNLSTSLFDSIISSSSNKKIHLKSNLILINISKLLKIRNELNLYYDLIELPDLYWEEPKLEKIYKLISKKLDVYLRVEILNKKLDYLIDESNILLSHLNEKKSSHLEWIIIWLIVIEVCFEICHFIEHYLEKKNLNNNKTLKDDK